MINTQQRSEAPEIMDDFAMEGDMLSDALDKIAGINRFLGGNSITIDGVNQLLRNAENKEIRILDAGCGNGDMLRELAKYANKHQLNFKLTGIDANAFTIDYAAKLSVSYPSINYCCTDIFNHLEEDNNYDIILCTLTLHHFKDPEILRLLAQFRQKATLGIVINDLQRSALPYYLFQIVCFVFRLNEMSRTDGLVSILRGFKRKDLTGYAHQLNVKNSLIRWKWAFRYQWIIPIL